MIVFIKQLMNMSEKILQSKIRTKRGIVGYVNKEIDNIYATCNIWHWETRFIIII